MKKYSFIFFLIMSMTFATACSSEDEVLNTANPSGNAGQSDVESVIESMIEKEESEKESAEEVEIEVEEVEEIPEEEPVIEEEILVEPVMEEPIMDEAVIEEPIIEEPVVEEIPPATSSPIRSIDIDLSGLSATMIYGEIFNMTVNPEAYYGKTVKVDGLFDYYEDLKGDDDYFGILIPDAAACCAQGFGITFYDGYEYIQGSPENGSAITVVGTFQRDTLMAEYGFVFFRLENAYFE